MATQGASTGWQTSMLAAIGAPATPNNIAKMNAWAQCEGGVPYNNPFFTTRNCCGGVSINSVGVKRYPTMADGIEANRQALMLGYYVAIVSNLRGDGSQQGFATAVGASPWGTSGQCIASVLKSGPVASGTPGSGILKFSYAQLQCLWTQAGGNQQYQAMAAAIAMAESGGNSQASHTNTNGSTDRGLWQINSSNGAGSTFDIMGNARAAVSMSGGGVNWRPWCTAYADGACGTRGGTYQGAGAPYQKFLNPSIQPDCNFSINGTNAAANIGSGGTPQAQTVSCSTAQWLTTPLECYVGGGGNPLINGLLKAILGSIINPLIQLLAGAMAVGSGAAFMVLGLYLVITNTKTGKQVEKRATQAAGLAATAASGGAAAPVTTTTAYETTHPKTGQPMRTTVQATRTGPPRQRTVSTRTTKQVLQDQAWVYVSGDRPPAPSGGT